jgi:hypothetical protein
LRIKRVRVERPVWRTRAMSSNLDLVRSIFAATERGELLKPAEWADAEIEWIISDGPLLAPG